MRNSFIFRASVIAALFAAALVARSAHVEAAASLYLQQRCESNGTVSLGFTWEGNDPQALQQWIDVSPNGTWQAGTYAGAGPIAGNVSTYVWPGWQAGTTYYARVNQQLSNGAWDSSITYRVDIQTCGGGSPAVTGPVAPLPQSSLPPAPQPQPQQQAPQQATTSQSSPGGPQIASLTSPIGRGKDATATVKTQPNASCTIAYTPPSGASSVADGLGPKTADGSGIVLWTWRISSNTNVGDGSLSVTCGGQTTTSKLVVIQ